MNIFQYDDLRIEVFNDPAYEVGSSSYLHHYPGDGTEGFIPNSKHGIKVYKKIR